MAWADSSGTEYAITFEQQQAAFYGWRRQPGERPREFRGRLMGRDSVAKEAQRFSAAEGWSGTVAFGDGGFLGAYQRVGEGSIGYRGRDR
ncbi:hypothetical protein [Actinoplanes sp. NBC_00393]|uniref:hypothetical protein n=1 Tax=Actinoplanes sp. NBC_00393 TaxID=2975953 RepID=UPI003FA41F0B